MKKRKKLFSMSFKHSMTGLIFVTPWIIGFLVFFLYPLYQSVIFSFSKVTITAKGRNMSFIGTKNFEYFFSKDPYFIERLVEFFKGIILEVPLILVFSLTLALLLNQKIRAKGLFRTLFFLPIIVVSGPVMNMLLNEGSSTIPLIEQYGIYEIVNNSLPNFLVEPITTLFSQLILILWYSGVPILIFFAGLQKIDISLYEASSIDGASSWISFWKIVMPSIRGMVLINAIYIIVFLATSEINAVIIWIRESMLDASNRGFGVASAAAWIYSICIALLLLVSYLLFGREAKDKVKHAQITRRRGY
ncbi:MAG: carbohydrate ABC transporter permease [Anaerocolumna sp.]